MIDPTKCCGCGACSAVCPGNCIEMAPDAEGFLQAVVSDPSGCTDCGLCRQVCPGLRQEENGGIVSVFCGQSQNDRELAESTSGGVFSILARIILEQGGCVWGVELDETGKTVFFCADQEKELARLRGAKYVACQQALPFSAIASQLESGRKVLFSGIPCQVKALDLYLIKTGCRFRREQLILVDLFCYGVQSPFAWERYLAQVNPEGKAIAGISMRRKQPSWEIYSMDIRFKDGSGYQKIRWKDPYLKTYSKALFNRPVCADCTAKSFPRRSDITLGDFWALDGLKLKQNFAVGKGMSIVIANSPAGAALAEQAKGQMLYQDLSPEQLHRLYPRLGQANKAHPKRADFMHALRNESFSAAVDRYVGRETVKQIKFHLRPLRRTLRRLKQRLGK